MTFDGKAFGAEIVAAVRGYLDSEIAPVVRRLDALEKQLQSLPAARDGKDADLDEVRRMLDDGISKAIAAIEFPAMPELPEPLPAPELPELPDIGAMVSRAVAEAIGALPTPKDGRSISISDVEPVIKGEIERQVAALPRPKDGVDGVGLAGAIIDRAGELVVTLTNGDVKQLGVVVAKDGDPGTSGTNGFNLEDFDAAVMDDGRTVLLSFDRGDMTYKVELGFPVMIYRGVFRDGEYTKGDTVTWAGSLWHCDAEKTVEKPGDGSPAWTLCAKKGRDGKDGIAKEIRAEPVRVGIPAEAR